MADSSYVPATGGTPSFGLPAPQVRLAQNNNGVPVQVSNDNPGLLQTPIDIAPANLIQVVVQDIPEAVFSTPGLALSLEMVALRRHKRVTNRGGYAHGAHTVPSGNGSWSRGGTHRDHVGNLLTIQRQTEWFPAQNGELLDVTAGPWSYMQTITCFYRDPTATTKFANNAVPVLTSTLLRRRYYVPPRHKSYCDFSYGRYAFRWAATDLSDTHSPQQRVSGPLSPIITVGQAVHPFIDEWIDWGDGPHKAATLNPSSSENIGKAWIGERRQNDV